jgi:cation transport ATPase
MVNMLEKQAKVQPSEENCRNMVNMLEKGRTVPKLAPQHQKKHTHHKKEERANINEKIEYARSLFLNAIRPHIKNGIGYMSGDKHNSRVNSNDKDSSSSQRATHIKGRSKAATTLTMPLMLLMLMCPMFFICLIMILMLLMFL